MLRLPFGLAWKRTQPRRRWRSCTRTPDRFLAGAAVRLEDRTLLAVPVLVKDINAGATNPSANSNVNFEFERVGDRAYFVVEHPLGGRDLMVTDGTSAGTLLVKELPDSLGAVDDLTSVNGTLFFRGYSHAGYELWKSDGTAAGTVMVKDIFGGYSSSEPKELFAAGNLLYFTAEDAPGNRELWKSDGTEAGTVKVKEIAAGVAGSTPQWLTDVNGTLYFTATNSTSGRELWKSDGTTVGTVMVKEIAAGVSGSVPTELVNFNGTLFFTAVATATQGRELWSTDGTSAGTTVVTDIAPAANASSSPTLLTVSGNRLFFVANNGATGNEMWVSDGTAVGTTLLLDINAGLASTTIASLTDVGGTLFFTAFGPGSSSSAPFIRLWKSDGTTAGTISLSESASSPVQLTNVQGTLYFFAAAAGMGVELWKSDGRESGTMFVSDVNPGPSGSDVRGTTSIGNRLIFLANDGVHGGEPWISDGTPAGTQLIKDTSPVSGAPSSPYWLTSINGITYFAADDGVHGRELWKTDGTTAGTVMVKDLLPGSGDSNPGRITEFNGLAYFTAGPNGDLWRSDGTPAGTWVVSPGSVSDSAIAYQVFEGRLYYWGYQASTSDYRLWSTDGTAAGTVPVTDGSQQARRGGSIQLVVANNTLFFPARMSNQAGELWAIQVGSTVPVMVKDINPGALSSSDPCWLTEFNNRLYFFATDAAGTQLWQSNGTSAGTFNTAPASGMSSPSYMTKAQGRLYFRAWGNSLGNELWQSDGTAAGTSLVKDITPGASNTTFEGLLSANGSRVLFVTRAGTQYRLWRSDGTESGTIVLKDVDSADPNAWMEMTDPVDGVAYFLRSDSTFGAELWSSDGTVAGTQLVVDLQLGPRDGFAFGPFKIGSRLYIVGQTLATGRELFAFDEPPTSIGLAGNTVTEGPAGRVVGTFSTVDSDTAETFTYSLVSGTGDAGNSGFAIAGAQLKLASALDFETQTTYSLRIRSTDSLGLSVEQVFTINVFDVNEFAVSAVIDTNPQSSVDEQAPVGTPVGITAFASDADATNNQITYSLVDDLGGRFAINPATGVVTVANPALIDYEHFPSIYYLNIRATSQDGSSSTAEFIVALNDVDEFDVGPVDDFDFTANAVTENAIAGTPVGITAHAFDADGSVPAITYSLIDNAGGRFWIMPSTGVVSVAPGAVIDREAVASFSIIVRASSTDGSFADQSFTINVLDVDEFGLGPISDTDQVPNEVLEGAANGTPVGITGLAVDPDATAPAPTYSLASSANGRFAIDPVTGVVTVARSEWLDREAASAWSITVKATMPDGSSRQLAFSVKLLDVSDTPIGTVTDADPALNQVLEGAPIGTAVGITGFAVDKDLSSNVITYSLTSNGNGRFAIDPVTGVVTVAKREWLDREAAAAWSVTVKATSQDGTSSVKAFTVTLLDAQDTPVSAISDTNPAGSAINENAANGTLVGITAFAVDKDLTNNVVSYSLASNAGGRFAIDPVTGVVTVAKSEWLDREAALAWSITVKATSQDGSSSIKAFSITLNDVNERPISAITDTDPAGNVILETAPNGTAVGITAKATDADATRNVVTYSLTNSANGRFTIDPVTGVVTIANRSLLDLEGAGAPAWSITVKATSQDGSSSQASYSIQVTGVNEFPLGAITDSDAGANQVQENVANGTLVGFTAFASDPDVTGDSVLYILLDNAGGRFTIDPVSGAVSIANGSLLDFEAASSHQITVQAASEDGTTSTASFTIAVVDVAEAPEIALSNSTINENPQKGTLVGSLSVRNLNTPSPVYTLVAGDGSTDNSKFTISGSLLKTNASLNFETRSSYSVRVQMKDAAGHTIQQVLTIKLSNVNEAPAGLSLSNSSIPENNASGTVIGTLSGVDPDAGDTLTYTLVSGTGSTDNVKFTIDGNQLKAATSFDYETTRSYSIRVRATDAAGLFFEKTFKINVTNGPG